MPTINYPMQPDRSHRELEKKLLLNIPILTPPDANGNHQFMFMLLGDEQVTKQVGDIIDMQHDQYVVTSIEGDGHSGICRLVENKG